MSSTISEAAVAFFVELGLELEGEATVEDARWTAWWDWTVSGPTSRWSGLRTAHGRLELTKFHNPPALSAQPNAPVNALGIRRIMFAVDDIDGDLARLRTHGAELAGAVEQYGDSYRLCYVCGPEGILLALAEQLS